MTADIAELGFKVDTSDIEQATKKFSLLDREFGRVEKSGGLVSRSFESAGEAGKKSGGLVSRAFSEASSSLEFFRKAALSLGGVVAGLGLASVATGAMDTYREFEKLQGMLKTATGSTEAASKAFDDLQKFAATTPYALSQAVEGFVKLKNMGLDPSIKSLTSYGNTAAAMGKDLMQMIEAVADASTGEFERLLEFGIKASKEGDKVKFTFQGVETTVANSSKAIQKYLLDIGNNKFGTAMSDQAATLNGKISNLKDSFAALQVQIVEKSGVADIAKTSIGALSDSIEDLAKNTELLLIPVGFLTALLAGKLVTATAGYVTTLVAQSAATKAAAAQDALKLASTVAATEAEAARTAAILAQTQAAIANATGMQRAMLIQTTLAPAQTRAAEAAAAHTAALAAQSAAMAGASGAARVLSGALALVGGPIGAMVIGVGALAYGLIQLSKQQELEGKAVKDLRGNYVDYQSVTKTVVGYNAEYLKASAERKAAIIEETGALKLNIKAEIDALQTRLETLRSNYQKAVNADAADPLSPSLAAIYDKDIAAKTALIADLKSRLSDVNTVIEANTKNTAVNTSELKKYGDETKKATDAIVEQSTQLGLTKEQQEALTTAYQKTIETIKAHEGLVKTAVESLQKQRIELEQGKTAAEYYTQRLNGLTDAEAKAAAGANQYNAFLQERNRLQEEAAGLTGGLVDQYDAKLKSMGLTPEALDFSAITEQTNAAITAADSFKDALQGAEEVGRNLGERVSNDMEKAAKAMQGVDQGFRTALKGMADAQEKTVNSVVVSMQKQVGTAAQIVAEFQKLGWSRQQAIGIAANLKQESEFRPNAVGDGGKAYGIAQWHGDRQANFAKAFGKSIKDSDLLEQIRFVHYELTKGSEQAAGRILKSTTTAADAAKAVSRYYERPLARDVEMDRRAGIAQAIAKSIGESRIQTVAVNAEATKTAANYTNQLAAVKYMGEIDGRRVTAKEIEELRTLAISNEEKKRIITAQQHLDAVTKGGLALRENELTQQQIGEAAKREILSKENLADYLAEEKKINLEIASIKDPSAPLREELAQRKLNQAQIDSLVTLQQKAAVLKQLDELQTNTDWIEQEIVATQQGVEAMNQLAAVREAGNLAKQAGVTLESSYGQQILASVSALQSKQRELSVVKQLMDDGKALESLDAEIAATKLGGTALAEANVQKDIRNRLDQLGITQESALGQKIAESTKLLAEKNKQLEIAQFLAESAKTLASLDAEIAATKLGSAALAEANLQKEIRNKLDALGLTQESALGQRIAETTRQLAAKNKELQLEQTLRGLRTENAWLEKEIAATQQGEKALKALNIQKRISEELDRQGIAAGTQAAAQITSMIQQQEGLKEKLASIQELRQPISQFFNDVLSGGKNAFKNLGDYILNWLKKMIVEFATNKLMLSIGMDGGPGGISSLLGGSGGLFSSITGLVTKGLGGLGTALSGGLSGIMGSIGGFVSAIPGWGWALAGVAAIASKFIGPSDPKARFTQGATTGQAMLGQGGYGNNPHNYQTAFGQIGFTAASDHIGRQKGFVEAAHKMMQSMVVLDAMIAKTLPNSIGKIGDALKGLETSGFSTAEMMKQRYVTIAKSLSTDLQAALANGKDLAAMSAEEIVAAFQYMSQVAESGLIPTLQQLGLAGNQSNESLLAFGIALSTAMGGIDKAKAALDNYYQAAYTDAERTAATQQQAKTAIDAYNQSLGFSGTQYIDTIAELRAYIEAQDKNTEAGRKAIAAALGMVDALKTLGGTAEEAAAKLKGQWDDFNNAAYTDAQKQQIATNQAKKSIDAFNQSLGLTGNKTIDNIIELRAYMRTLDGNTEAGRKAQQAALGMTSAFVAFGGTAEQIKQKVAGLRESIKGLVTNLYSSSSLTSTSTTPDSNQAALSAAQSNLDSLRSQLNSEQDRISEVNNQAKEAYQNQLDYFRTLKDAAEDLRNVANGFADDARSAADVLKSAQLDYNRTLQAAKSGDVEAAKKLGDMATRLKSAVSVAYNNDGRAASAIQQIEDQLRTTAGVLDGLAGSQPNDPGTITSTLIASLQSQISAQESVVSSLQSIASNASTAANEAKATADRTAMAKELATKIGELGLATDKSAWQILTANGINIKDLAKDFGINVNQLDATFVKKVAELSGLLNVNSLQMLNKLGVSATELAAAYGINVDKLDKTMVNKIGELASQLNVNSFDLLKKMGVTTQELAAAYGLNTDKLNQNFLTKLDSLADVLRVSSVDLAAKLGVNIGQLGDLMANKLASLPNIPADIKAGLAPHLQDIRNAADPATLQRELKELQAYVNTLPPGIREQLNAQLQGILGYTGDTKTNTNDTKNETMALRNVSSRITDLTIYTRDQLTGQYLTGVWQNLKSLNNNAANIGKSAIPSFAVGSDKLPNDMLANVHRGEMIFTAAQSNSMRDLAIYNQAVIPQIASYLSEIAANDEQAPVFIQPVYVAPANNQHRQDGSKKDDDSKALREEIKELKKAIETMIPYQSAIANNTRKSAAMMDKWDADGQPEERVA